MIKKKVVFEDVTQQYNKWVSGIASRELHASQISLKDLLGKDGNPDDTQSLINSKSSKNLPYPLSNVLGEIKDLFSRTNGVRSSLSSAFNFPLIAKNDHTKQVLNGIIKSLDNIKKELQHIDKALDTKLEKD